jgi:signal transduction histidine kinase
VVGAVEVRSDLRNVEGVLGDLRRRILAAVAGSALLAGLIGLWRARAIAKPLRELTGAAQALADGDFTKRLPKPKGHDEVALLTATFGEMRDRVQHELGVRNAFVADASHELRTPLTAIRGAVEILQDGGAERPEVRDRFLQTLGNETNRLLGLVDGLLQLETNDQGFALDENVELGKLIHEVCLQMQPIAQSKFISLFCDSYAEVEERGNSSLRGSEAKLRQVFMNLIDNAITYSPPSTTVRIRLQTDKQRMHRIIEVCDEGPGIPEADRERVFERFVRLDQSRNRVEQNQIQQSQIQQNQIQKNQIQQSEFKQSSQAPNNAPLEQPSPGQTPRNPSTMTALKPGGAGLGLAIARSIAQAHGGTLSFHSGLNGIGTTARVCLPVGAPKIPVAAKPMVTDPHEIDR